MQKSLLLAVVACVFSGTVMAETLTPTPRKDYLFFPRTHVLEEGTGTWCGFCPRGIETIERLRPIFGERLIPIAVHQAPNAYSYEPMEVRDYRFLAFQGFPGGYLNRKVSIGMSFGSTKAALEELDRKSPHHDGKTPYLVEAELKKVDALDYELTTRTTLGFNTTQAQLRLQYVLVEDSVGPYSQRNYFSGNNIDGTAPSWVKKPDPAPTVYNDVARMVYPTASNGGDEGRLPTTFRRGEAVTQNFHLFLPGTVANVRKTRVAVLLLDAETGEILNAASAVFPLVSGIAPHPAAAASTNAGVMYDLSGKIVTQPTAGQVIIAQGKKRIYR